MMLVLVLVVVLVVTMQEDGHSLDDIACTYCGKTKPKPCSGL